MIIECPVCQQRVVEYLPFGTSSLQPPRPNAQCPHCKSLERHRLITLYFRNCTNLFYEKIRMFHVAPEPEISTLLKKTLNIDYITGDLDQEHAMFKIDLTDIKFPDNFFDVVYASHVLELITDDLKAMREIHRVLKPSGWAILQVPINGKITVEDPTITDPKERERVFGQFDHVRQYGHDGVYKNRLETAGFNVKIDQYVRSLYPDLIKKYGLMQSEDIYYCTKTHNY